MSEHIDPEEIQSTHSAYHLPGETVIFGLYSEIHFPKMHISSTNGFLVFTNFKLYYTFHEYQVTSDISIRDLIDATGIPYGQVVLMEEDKRDLMKLKIKTNDFRVVEISFFEVMHKIESLGFIQKKKEVLHFPFDYGLAYQGDREAGIYDVEREFERLQFRDEDFFVSDINEEFLLCESYPKKLIFPTRLSNQVLMDSRECRYMHRIPTVMWICKDSKAVLARSSENEGLSNYGDKAIISSLKKKAPSMSSPSNFNPMLRVLACNSEKQSSYSSFVGLNRKKQSDDSVEIPTTEQIKSSFNSWRELLWKESLPSRRAFDDTEWIKYIEMTMKSANLVSRQLREGTTTVLVSQLPDNISGLSSITQLLLDPFYRTTTGFGHLVQKEFLLMGVNETCLLIHFLDCVYQIQMQYPSNFEFNEKYLIFLADSISDFRFGSFIGTCEKDRVGENVNERTVSVWSWILNDVHHEQYTNINYLPSNEPMELITSTALLKVWTSYYTRFSRTRTSSQSISRTIYSPNTRQTNIKNQIPARQQIDFQGYKNKITVNLIPKNETIYSTSPEYSSSPELTPSIFTIQDQYTPTPDYTHEPPDMTTPALLSITQSDL